MGRTDGEEEGGAWLGFKQRLSQYRFLRNELKNGNALEPEKVQAEIRDIERTVGGIGDARVRQALFMRYLSANVYSWSEVASVVHYSEGRIRTLVREELRRIG